MVSDACCGVADTGAGSGTRADAFLLAYAELEQELEWDGADAFVVAFCYAFVF